MYNFFLHNYVYPALLILKLAWVLLVDDYLRTWPRLSFFKQKRKVITNQLSYVAVYKKR